MNTYKILSKTKLVKQKNLSHSFIHSRILSGGLYILSFAFELRSILQNYLQCLSQLEHQCLIDTSLTLSHLLTSLTDYFHLFPALVALVTSLQTSSYRGCQILDLIRRSTLDGNTILSSTMKKLLCASHRILIKQVTSILTRGQIYDEHNEFFIGLNTNINVDAMGLTTPSLSRMTSTVTSRAHSPERLSGMQVIKVHVNLCTYRVQPVSQFCTRLQRRLQVK